MVREINFLHYAALTRTSKTIKRDLESLRPGLGSLR